MTILTSTALLLLSASQAGTGTLESPKTETTASNWTLPEGIVLDKDGAAEVQKRFRGAGNQIVDSLWVETSFDSDGDGRLDRVYVDVTRPKQTEDEGLRVAAIYETSPYYWGVAGGGPETFWDPIHELGGEPPERPHPSEIERPELRGRSSSSYVRTFVPRGFAVVHSASPGTGYSQGCPTVGGENESLAPKAVIDWLCGRAKGFDAPTAGEEVVAHWCTGQVAMIGTSYNGTLPIAAACTGVEGLRTIVPVAPNTSYYHYYRSNGLVRHPGGHMGEDIDVLYDFIHSGEPGRRAWCNQNVRDDELLANLDRITGDYSAWWSDRDYVNKLGGLKTPVLMAHAFNDWNVMPEHSFRVREALKAKGIPTICYYHQGGHGGDPPLDLLVRWMTRWLYDVENGVEDGPKAYIVREGEKRSNPTAYPEYPHPGAEALTLRPSGDGRRIGILSGEAGTGEQTLLDDVSVTRADMAKAPASAHRLLFASPLLEAPLHLSGVTRVKLRMAASKPAVNLSVYLVSLPWTDERALWPDLVTAGWADPQNASSLETSTPLVPGEFVELEFDLQPDDQILAVGEQLGLMIFASDAAHTLKPEAGTKLTVDLSETSIDLPVVGGEGAWKKAIGE